MNAFAEPTKIAWNLIPPGMTSEELNELLKPIIDKPCFIRGDDSLPNTAKWDGWCWRSMWTDKRGGFTMYRNEDITAFALIDLSYVSKKGAVEEDLVKEYDEHTADHEA